jgi:hypothetical protein
MSTAYSTVLYNSKVGASDGHGLNRVRTSLHAISGSISTWAAGDTIAVGWLPRQAIVVGANLKAAGQLDTGGSPSLALDLGVVGATQLFKAAITTVGHASGGSIDTTNTVAGTLWQNTSGADAQVILTVHTAAATPAAGTLEVEISYFVEDLAGSNP